MPKSCGIPSSTARTRGNNLDLPTRSRPTRTQHATILDPTTGISHAGSFRHSKSILRGHAPLPETRYTLGKANVRGFSQDRKLSTRGGRHPVCVVQTDTTDRSKTRQRFPTRHCRGQTWQSPRDLASMDTQSGSRIKRGQLEAPGATHLLSAHPLSSSLQPSSAQHY